ncbi:S-adenosyl-L-methionine-dependent methyltransferase [Mycena pura]|uniref:S-adenosyl-L-methionine-dependent methyltransferase n=1 Tax=Mycena pura TaxID=153505 RepID=A0AAD6VSM5_9AGAR|nr:S-adenosyl-L-methionine-dependent methyltransferase [Mycena pura]
MSSPHHHHHYPANQTHHTDYVSANQAFFDQHAHQAEHRPMASELAESVRNAILNAYPFDKDATAILDYACGTGIVSRGLAPHCKTLVGVDISQGMVDEFNKGVQNHGLSAEQMRAVRTELKGEDSELGGDKFDVVMCSLAYHHIEDITAVTRLLAFFLKPGGVLLVVDLPTMDITALPPGAAGMIPHKGGVSEDAIKAAFSGAGLQDFELVLFKGPKTPMHTEDIFLAKGVKGAV